MAMVSTGMAGSSFFMSIAKLLPEPPLRRSSDRISAIESSCGQNSISLLRSTHQLPPVMKPCRAPAPAVASLIERHSRRRGFEDLLGDGAVVFQRAVRLD